MTKYYCDHCGEEIEISKIFKFSFTFKRIGHCECNVDILLHESCAEELLRGFSYEKLIKGDYDLRKELLYALGGKHTKVKENDYYV